MDEKSTEGEVGKGDHFDRRALLAGFGGAALGAAGVSALLPATGHAAITLGRMDVYNVKDAGAQGDGTTNDTADIQEAIDSAKAAGGGIVFFPPGTYSTNKLTLPSRVHIQGSGIDATVVKLRSGSNSAVFESEGFAGLTGTSSAGGISGFSVRHLVIDGNKQQNPGAGYGLRIYGFQYELNEIITHNCRNHGIYSEWSGPSNLPVGSHQMEARYSGVRSHDNGGDGIHFLGPHDSLFSNCLAFYNGPAAPASPGAGFRFAGVSHGSHLVNCHAWSQYQTSFDIGARAIGCANCYADIHDGLGVVLRGSNANEFVWSGGRVIAWPGSNGVPAEVGIRFEGVAGAGPSGCLIDTYIQNCRTSSIHFADDGGGNVVRANVYPRNGTGPLLTGTPSKQTRLDVTHGMNPADAINHVTMPTFDMHARTAPTPNPQAADVRIFTRESQGKIQLCAKFATGPAVVIATAP